MILSGVEKADMQYSSTQTMLKLAADLQLPTKSLILSFILS